MKDFILVKPPDLPIAFVFSVENHVFSKASSTKQEDGTNRAGHADIDPVSFIKIAAFLVNDFPFVFTSGAKHGYSRVSFKRTSDENR